MRHFAFLLAMVSLSTTAAAEPDSEAMRIACDAAAPEWAPVRLPEAGVDVFVPCSDAELSAYKNANEERKRMDGFAGCQRDGRNFVVLYLVNTPAGFFDRFTGDWKATPAQNFQVSGHRVFRAATNSENEAAGQQLVEIDGTRSILMSTSSKSLNDVGFAKVTSCFFNTLHFVKS